MTKSCTAFSRLARSYRSRCDDVFGQACFEPTAASGRSPVVGGPGCRFLQKKTVDVGVHDKEAELFTKGPKNFRLHLETLPPEARRNPGGTDVNKYQRSASAPYRSRIRKGSTVLPLDLDIFLAVLVRMSSMDTQSGRKVFPRSGGNHEHRIKPPARLVDSSAMKSAGNFRSNKRLSQRDNGIGVRHRAESKQQSMTSGFGVGFRRRRTRENHGVNKWFMQVRHLFTPDRISIRQRSPPPAAAQVPQSQRFSGVPQ